MVWTSDPRVQERLFGKQMAASKYLMGHQAFDSPNHTPFVIWKTRVHLRLIMLLIIKK